jgi:transposase, IS6 family
VRLYLRYPLSYEQVAELAAERGVEVDASCIWRRVQVYTPELNKRRRSHLKPANKSYRIDETYIKVKGADKYLYRAVDSTGQTIDFLLTAKRDTAAAKRFLYNAIEASGNGMPRVAMWTRILPIRLQWKCSKRMASSPAASLYASANISTT